jgi:hypothetical protein
MKKSNRIKRWQLNIFVCYYGQKNASSYRFNILEFLKHLASIHRLDYAISVDYKFSSDTDSSRQSGDTNIYDLIHLRSNDSSSLERKDFRAIIDCTFRKLPSPFYGGVEVWTQLYKDLKKFPFPTDFYRPLIYPYIEHHKASHKKLLVYTDRVLEMIEEEQDYSLN